MLRIDVDHPTGDRHYSIPADNPYINTPGARPEIWAYGFRNPWRMDFDLEKNQLWLGQNGQDCGNRFISSAKVKTTAGASRKAVIRSIWSVKRGDEPITPPVAEHHHSESRSLTGGVVYRGRALPELNGTFLYGDYSTGKIWGIRHDGQQTTFHQELADTTLQIAGFGVNHAGELLVVDHGGGIYRMEKTPPQTQPEFPRRLSETGLFASVSDHRMAAGVVPYAVNAQLWSDGAHKERWMAVPGHEQIEYSSNRGWTFPNGSVLVKSFAIEMNVGQPESRKWIETRLMVRQDNEWTGYSYRWNADQSDAELLDRSSLDIAYDITDPNGSVAQQTWHYPSRAECMVCHSRAANYVLGTCEAQMNREYTHADGTANQIEWLAARQYFRNPPEKPAESCRNCQIPSTIRCSWIFVLARICMPTVPDVILKRVGVTPRSRLSSTRYRNKRSSLMRLPCTRLLVCPMQKSFPVGTRSNPSCCIAWVCEEAAKCRHWEQICGMNAVCSLFVTGS